MASSTSSKFLIPALNTVKDKVAQGFSKMAAASTTVATSAKTTEFQHGVTFDAKAEAKTGHVKFDAKSWKPDVSLPLIGVEGGFKAFETTPEDSMGSRKTTGIGGFVGMENFNLNKRMELSQTLANPTFGLTAKRGVDSADISSLMESGKKMITEPSGLVPLFDMATTMKGMYDKAQGSVEVSDEYTHKREKVHTDAVFGGQSSQGLAAQMDQGSFDGSTPHLDMDAFGTDLGMSSEARKNMTVNASQGTSATLPQRQGFADFESHKDSEKTYNAFKTHLTE